MEYTIKHITAQHQLDDALNFARRMFPDLPGNPAFDSPAWRERIKHNKELLLYAESNGEIVGLTFGHIEDNGSLTAGIVAVDERLRNRGLAGEMMVLLEKRGKALGADFIALGAVQSAEGFYQKLGYTGTLLVQSRKHSIDDLLSLNTKYAVNYTRIYDGTINQINLALPEADRGLQRKYETSFPGCSTQMMFWKNI